MLDKQQEGSIREQFKSVQGSAWYKWFAETVAANRDAALNRLENSAELNDLLRHQSELKAWRQVADLLTKFLPKE